MIWNSVEAFGRCVILLGILGWLRLQERQVQHDDDKTSERTHQKIRKR